MLVADGAVDVLGVTVTVTKVSMIVGVLEVALDDRGVLCSGPTTTPDETDDVLVSELEVLLAISVTVTVSGGVGG